jgi:hypothetical protein
MVPDLGLVAVLLSQPDPARPALGAANRESYVALVNSIIIPAVK